MPNVGPTANLPGTARRRGRSGTAWRDSKMLGEVTAVDWDVELEQIDVLIPGSWRNEQIAGAETRRGTYRHQDVDDRFKLEVWRYIDARRRGDRTATIPNFNLVTKIDDTNAPDYTQWALIGCQLFSYSGGYSNEDDLLNREVPFTFQDDKPLHAFEYAESGIIVTEQ